MSEIYRDTLEEITNVKDPKELMKLLRGFLSPLDFVESVNMDSHDDDYIYDFNLDVVFSGKYIGADPSCNQRDGFEDFACLVKNTTRNKIVTYLNITDYLTDGYILTVCEKMKDRMMKERGE